MPTVQSWPALLDQLLNGESLSAPQATALMQGWLSEQIDPVLTGGLLAALRAKGVSGEELAAMAEVLREACPLPASRPALALVDTCGTGGDGADSFNISTAVAFWGDISSPQWNLICSRMFFSTYSPGQWLANHRTIAGSATRFCWSARPVAL